MHGDKQPWRRRLQRNGSPRYRDLVLDLGVEVRLKTKTYKYFRTDFRTGNLAALGILEHEAAQQDEAVDSAKNTLRLFTDRYVGGRDNYLQVITAQTEYLGNERNQVEITRRRMEASVLLVKALGGGWTAAALAARADIIHSTSKSTTER
jgi:hypothetical protein